MSKWKLALPAAARQTFLGRKDKRRRMKTTENGGKRKDSKRPEKDPE
jgi:hypothetical protein